jgi:hypothetical protein
MDYQLAKCDRFIESAWQPEIEATSNGGVFGGSL